MLEGLLHKQTRAAQCCCRPCKAACTTTTSEHPEATGYSDAQLGHVVLQGLRLQQHLPCNSAMQAASQGVSCKARPGLPGAAARAGLVRPRQHHNLRALSSQRLAALTSWSWRSLQGLHVWQHLYCTVLASFWPSQSDFGLTAGTTTWHQGWHMCLPDILTAGVTASGRSQVWSDCCDGDMLALGMQHLHVQHSSIWLHETGPHSNVRSQVLLLTDVHIGSRTHACTHARTHARTHTRTHARTHARTHSCTHAHTHARTHARTHTCPA